MISPRPPVLLGVLVLASLCTQSQAASTKKTAAVTERPWEVIADNGDMVLPDLYYSENGENEQVMPVTVHGRRQIDHLVYPTIGNPKLYLKDAPNDSLMLVLRLEKDKYLTPFSPESDDHQLIRGRKLFPLALNPSQPGDGISFYLVPRGARGPGNDVGESKYTIRGAKGVIAITPDQLGVQPHYPNMPQLFLKRETVRAYFDKALKSIPEGLYDIRVEVVSGGVLIARDSTYNGLQIFDTGPKEGGDFTVLNFSDAQINKGWVFQKFAVPHLKELVSYLTTTNNPQVTGAKYITFNGDLHDGGAVLQRYPRGVSTEYQNEAIEIFDELKQLKKPIFLTCGNHDGYASMGHVPEAISNMTLNPALQRDADRLAVDIDETRIGKALKKLDPNIKLDDPTGLDPIDLVVQDVIDSRESTWPNLSTAAYDKYILDTKNAQGGRHLDIFQGRHVRKLGDDFSSWQEVPRAERNMVLYDGQYQWRKTYGPLYYGYSFGKNYYLSLNTFELRQHWRSGWGMYTVNYGGGLSEVQMDWLSRELKRQAGRDVTLFAHHDPRGGHNGKDYPYFFGYVDYGTQVSTGDSAATKVLRPDYFVHASSMKDKLKEWFDGKETAAFNKLFKDASAKYGDNGGMMYSFFNFALSDTIEKALCSGSSAADKDVAELGCMHDGLQEWMTRDQEFDCNDLFRQADGKCIAGHSWYSGFELVNLIATNTNVRTMVLGHTHFNSIDEFQSGDELVPDHVTLGADTLARMQSLEGASPMRGSAITEADVNDKAKAKVTYPFQRVLQGKARELVIIRVTTAADLTSQYIGDNGKDKMFGFQALTFSLSPDFATGQPFSKLNRIDFYRNLGEKKANYGHVAGLNIDRTAEMRAANGRGTAADAELVKSNPLRYLFRLGKGATKDTRTDDQIIEDAIKE